MEVSQKIAASLLQKRLVACANILPGVTSMYEWEGKMCTDSEHLMILKTQTSLISQIVTEVKAIHPYDCPEVISLPQGEGSNDYLKWLKENTTPKIIDAEEKKSEEKK
jgi:periplasmic divalent cation tolerance protein